MSNNNYKRNLPIPFFSQRENKYQWQRLAIQNEEYEGKTYNENEEIGSPVPMASRSCNITSLCMLLHYYGITEDTPDMMLKDFFEKKLEGFEQDFRHEENVIIGDKYLGSNRVQLWGLLEQFAEKQYNLPSRYVNYAYTNLNEVKKQIGKGNPVMFSNKFTSGGHIAVIRGFTKEGHIIINDLCKTELLTIGAGSEDE